MKRSFVSQSLMATMIASASVGLAGCGGSGDQSVPARISAANTGAGGSADTGGGTNTGGNTNTGGGTTSGPVDRARATTVTKQAVGGIRSIGARLREDPTGATGRMRRFVDSVRSGKQSTRQAGQWQYDDDSGLYVKYDFTGAQSGENVYYRVLYAVNADGSDPAGFAEASYEATGTDPNNPYPVTYRFTFNITKGKEPRVGGGAYVIESVTPGVGIRGYYTYNVTNPVTGETESFSARFDENGYYYDSVGFTEDGVNYDVSNVNRSSNGDIEGDVATSGVTGRVLLRADDSGRLTFPTIDGDVISNWDTNGVGTILYADGSTEGPFDFDDL